MNNLSQPFHFAFFGTPDVAATALEILKKAGLVPDVIVTNPDRPQGRGLMPAPSPVKVFATQNDIHTIQPEREMIKSGALEKSLAEYATAHGFTWDVFVVVAYGAILPQTLLDIPKRGTVNLHFSLLPKHRGAAPVQAAMLADDKATGITLFKLDAKMDHGPIIATLPFNVAHECPNGEWPPLSDLLATLAEKGGALLAEKLPLWIAGKIEPIEQDHAAATFTGMIKKEDGLLILPLENVPGIHNPTHEYEIFRRIQAYKEWPGAYFYARTQTHDTSGNISQIKSIPLRVKITAASWNAKENNLRIEKVIPEGRREMTYQDFRRSYIPTTTAHTAGEQHPDLPSNHQR